MRVFTAFGLAVLLASLATCEERTIERCLLPDYKCADGYFCKPIADDPNNVGMCVASECTYSAVYTGSPNGCDAATPICTSEGHCIACTNNNECSVANPALPLCSANKTCVACLSSADCMADPLKPACDTDSHTCGPCTKHSQCLSQACVKDDTLAKAKTKLTRGMCVPPTNVLVVQDTCATTTCPISFSDDKPYILLKNYNALNTTGHAKVPITVPAATVTLPEIHIITTTADLSPPALTAIPTEIITDSSMTVPAVTASPGASVTLEGLTIKDSTTGLLCNSDNFAKNAPMATSVKLIRSIIGGSATAIVTHPQCKLTLDSSWIGTGPPLLSSIEFGNDQAMVLDTTQFDITNSVFVHNENITTGVFGGISILNGTNGAFSHIVNSTFDKHEYTTAAAHNALAVYCSGTTPISTLSIFNNIFVNSMATAGRHYVDLNCISGSSYGYSATDENPAPSGTNIVTTGVSEQILAANSSLVSTAPTTVSAGGATSFTNGTDKAASPTLDILGNARSTKSPSMGAYELSH